MRSARRRGGIVKGCRERDVTGGRAGASGAARGEAVEETGEVLDVEDGRGGGAVAVGVARGGAGAFVGGAGEGWVADQAAAEADGAAPAGVVGEGGAPVGRA